MSLHRSHADGPEVRPGQAGGYFVRSATTPGAWWFVHETGEREIPVGCSCPAGQRALDIGSRKFCRHLRAVFAHVAEINRRQARPRVPTNASAIVD